MNFCDINCQKMPSKLAEEAAQQMQAKLYKGLPADELKSVLEEAEQNVKAKANISTIFNQEAEDTVARFDLEGKCLSHYIC